MTHHDDSRLVAAIAAQRPQDKDLSPPKSWAADYAIPEPVAEPVILGHLINTINRARACTPVHAGARFI